MASSTYKLGKVCKCGQKMTDKNTVGLCLKCYRKTNSFVSNKRKGSQ